MILEFTIFVAAILLGIVLYWRESKGNKTYRFLNKIMNSKELQMKPDDQTGFVFQQKFLLRLVFITALFLIILLLFRVIFLIDTVFVSLFISSIAGTLIGTYVAGLVIKAEKVIDEKSGEFGEMVSETYQKGKEFIDDLTGDTEQEKAASNRAETSSEKTSEKSEKSARERLKDKGLL